MDIIARVVCSNKVHIIDIEGLRIQVMPCEISEKINVTVSETILVGLRCDTAFLVVLTPQLQMPIT